MQFLHTQIQNVDSQKCLVANNENSEAVLYSCSETVGNQIFFLTERKEIRNYDLCMDAASSDGSVKTLNCHLSGGNQEWEYDEQVSGN